MTSAHLRGRSERATPQCWTCFRPIRFVLTVKGKRMPLDPRPSPEGNVRIVVEDGGPAIAHVLDKASAAAARDSGEQLYLSHFKTCPQGDQHRRPR